MPASHLLVNLSSVNNFNTLAPAAYAQGCYVNYYESQKENIDEKFGTNPQEWPDTINIARHIRNGFSHGGTFYITNPNTDELEWRNLKLDYSMHNDEVLFQNGLGPGDIILFMDDLDQLL